MVEEKFKEKALLISAKLEEELIDFSEEERTEYLKECGSEKTGLERLIVFAYDMLDLITYYTIKGGKELHSWSLRRGDTAINAAGQVHSDFAKNFIKAEVVPVNFLLGLGDIPTEHENIWNLAREKGLLKLEGKDYIVQDKDVIEFKVGS